MQHQDENRGQKEVLFSLLQGTISVIHDKATQRLNSVESMLQGFSMMKGFVACKSINVTGSKAEHGMQKPYVLVCHRKDVFAEGVRRFVRFSHHQMFTYRLVVCVPRVRSLVFT